MPNSPTVIPLAELSGVETRLNWQLPLPPYISRELGVHLPTVDSLAQWGALGAVTVAHGKVEQDDTPAIGGTNGADAAVVSTALNFFRQPTKGKWGTATTVERADNYYWADATISVDL